MSLLATFVAMLGKQWLSRYLRRTGDGSMGERRGDWQREFDGIEKWPPRFFIGSLPVMLQFALLLPLAACRGICGPSTLPSHTLLSPSLFLASSSISGL